MADYVCTFCGNRAKDPKEIMGCGGCLTIIIGSIIGGFFVYFIPLGGVFIGSIIALVTLVIGIRDLLKTGKQKCPRCGHLGTMVSSASPKGRQLIREAGKCDSDDHVHSEGQVSQDGSVARLTEIKALLDKGMISPEEYEAKRKHILDSI